MEVNVADADWYTTGAVGLHPAHQNWKLCGTNHHSRKNALPITLNHDAHKYSLNTSKP